jgi:hypothetical protein
MTDPISKNPDAERIVGLRDTGHGDAIIITAPAEDCRKCNKDFPSCICAVDIDKAIQVYLKTVEQAIEFHEGKKEKL